MDRGVLVYTRDPTLRLNTILERKEFTLMPENNLNEVPQIFPHTIAVFQIQHSRAAYDLIKWCVDNLQHNWIKHVVDNIVYIQLEQESDLSLFLLYWGQDTRIEYTLIDIASELGL